MHITPKFKYYFQFYLRTEKKIWRIADLGFQFESGGGGVDRLDYRPGLSMTRTIPGRRVAKFPLFSFRASTVMLCDLAIEESVSPGWTL
jgi:hypothetical protein